MLTPRASGKFIASCSGHVKIYQTGVKRTAKLVSTILSLFYIISKNLIKIYNYYFYFTDQIYDAIVDGSIERSTWTATHHKYPDRQAVDWYNKQFSVEIGLSEILF